LAAKGWSGVVLEAFSENWKPGAEGDVGKYWNLPRRTALYLHEFLG